MFKGKEISGKEFFDQLMEICGQRAIELEEYLSTKRLMRGDTRDLIDRTLSTNLSLLMIGGKYDFSLDPRKRCGTQDRIPEGGDEFD